MNTAPVERYTSFPDLNYGQEELPSSSSVDWKVDICQLTVNTLILSWASLLKSFTGHENPVFCFNGQAIKADLAAKDFRAIDLEGNIQGQWTFTGIFTIDARFATTILSRFSDYHLLTTASGKNNPRWMQSGQIIHEQHFESKPGTCRYVDIRPDLSILNPNPEFLPGPSLLHDLVRLEGCQNDLAIEFLNSDRRRSSLSFESLHFSSTKLSLRLVAALESLPTPSKRNPVIPLLLPQCVHLYVAWLAILKAGASVCPLSLDTPPERVNFIANDVCADVIITTQSLSSRLDHLDRTIHIITVDDGDPNVFKSEEVQLPQVYTDDIAYLEYTSGSTGLPKGVAVSHRAATQALLAHDKWIPSFKRFLQFASPTFDVSIFEIFFPLFRGATLVGCDRNLMLGNLPGIITELDVDAAELTPTVTRELLHKRAAAPCLKVLLTIGEMLTRGVVDEFGGSPDNDGILYGMYGPTEASIHCTIAPKVLVDSRVGNIGVPLQTVSAFIISLETPTFCPGDGPKILPIGHVGELAVGGHQLAECYVNRDEETRKAFLDTTLYGRIYRTGDKARLHPSGELECLGRISAGQVKLRGQRIELGEIERVIYKVPGICSAVVSVLKGILVAFVSVDKTFTGIHGITRICQDWLPKFMVPGDVEVLDHLPRLPSGKVDKATLESTYLARRHSQHTTATEFDDDIQRSVASCVEGVLYSNVSKSASLAAAGLDSLKAIKLSSVLRNAGINVEVLGILEADSIEGISSLSRQHDDAEAPATTLGNFVSDDWKVAVNSALDDIKTNGYSADYVDIVPCSPVQIAMLSESMRDPKAYFNWIELQFHRGIGILDIKNAFYEIASQNEILRSGFIPTDHISNPHVQVIWSRMMEDQVQEVSELRYDQHLNIESRLLRPLRIDFTEKDGLVHALVHIHHAQYDGWSWDQILNDIEDLLSSRTIKPRPQYRLFTDYYLTRISSEDRESAIHYWQDQLEGIKSNPWPNFQDTSDTLFGLRTAQRLLKVNVEELDVAVRTLRVSRQAIFQAAFGYLLSAYNGNHDTIFGFVSSGRTRPIDDIENIIGPCVTTIPMRFNLDKLRTVRDLIGAIHNLNRKSLKYDFLPLSDIKQASGIDPGVSLFDSLFVWQETISEGKPHSPLVTQIKTGDFLEFTMTLELEIQGENVAARANFQQSILPDSQVDIFLHQIEQLALIFINTPELLLRNVNDYLPNSTLSIENLNFMKQSDLPGLADGVEKIASIDPERAAIEFLDAFDPYLGTTSITKLTYGGLDIRSNQIANYLRSCGLSPNDLVSMFLEKSINLYVAILAVIKAGCGYVPITPQTPVNRVHTIINEAKCSFCVTDSSLISKLRNIRTTEIIAIDNINFDNLPGNRPEVEVSDSSVAYCTFTSGSTGKPKGVLISHHNLQSNIAVLSEIYPNPPRSRLLQSCSHAFDVSVFEIFYSLTRGMTLCSAINDVLFRDIEQAIRAMNVTHLSLTPTVASLLNPDNIPKVKFLVTAGEAMTEKVFKSWAGRGVYQVGYGPSETTNICTVQPDLKPTDLINNIGRPFKNTSAFVISGEEGFTLLPRGAVGEFCFGGEQVGCGYLNMPDLTRSKFICHPQYGRIYRSGDFGRMLSNGSLVFTGRRDDQVKLRGQRIELGEINRALLQDPEVSDCTTLIIGDAFNEKQQLISFWVPALQHGSNFSTFEDRSKILRLFDHIGTILPGYMVPSMLIPIQAIPMTTSGKTDKDGLLKHFQSLDPEALHLSSSEVEALSDKGIFSHVEMKVAEAVAKVTQTPLTDIALHTSFYSLGLDSISAITLSRNLKVNGFGQVDVSTIMKHNTVYRLSKKYLECNNQLRKKKSTPNIHELFSAEFKERVRKGAEMFGGQIRKILPCTPLQEAMLMRRSTDKYMAYYNRLLFEVRDVAKLKYAWDTMVRRHDILRSYFTSTDDARFSFAQIVLESIDLPWKELITTTDKLHDRIEDEELELTNSKENIVPYSFVVFRIANEGNKMLLMFLIHHALYDAEAMAQLLCEVEHVSFGIDLPPVIPFDLYLEQMVSMDIEETDRFWNSHLSDLSPSHLLNLQPRTDTDGLRKFRSVETGFNISLSKVVETCKNMSITLLSLVQAAWAKLLFCYTETSDICFGNVFNCRSIPVDGAEHIIGPCLNTLPIRIKAHANTVNLDLAKILQQYNADVMPYQLTSLRRLQSQFGRTTSLLFDTLVLLQSCPRPLNDKLWSPVEEKGDMDIPLVSEVVPDNEFDVLCIILHYDDSYFVPKDMDIMLGGFMELIHHILLYPFGRAMDSSVVRLGLPSFIHEHRRRLTDAVGDANGTIFSKDVGLNSASETLASEIRQVQKVLSNLSKIELAYIKPHTTIFQLGLDSINAVQISGQFKALGHDISVNDILENPSVSELASLFSRQKGNGDKGIVSFDFESFRHRHWLPVCHKLGLPETCLESIRPCTPVQSGMLALFTQSEGRLYFNHLVLESTVLLDAQTLQKAWNTLTEKHEILRAGFVHVDDDEFPFAMITYKRGAFQLPWAERAELAIHGNERFSDRQRMSKNAFSQLHRPPWQVSFQQSGSHLLIQFSALHSLYDAHSLRLLLSDLSGLLRGEALAPAIPILPIQSSIISASIQACKDLKCETFWKELGNDLRATKFPDMNPLYQKKEINVLARKCSESLKSLQEGCRVAGVTLHAAGQASWARILSSYTGESRVTCGLVLSGRNTIEGAERAVFPCLTTVPSSYSIEGSNGDLLKRIMKLDASLVKYQFTPLPKIRQWAGSGSSLFDTIFVFQKHLATTTNENWKVYNEEARTDYPISIELIPVGGTLEFQLTFETDILPKGQADILLRQLDGLLIDTIFYPDSPCTYFTVLESKDLLSAIPAKEPKIPSPVKLVHQFVEYQARDFPLKIALEFASRVPGNDKLVKQKWTYKGFNNSSNRYANLLQRNGAFRGDLIGICFDKCPEAYFAILAILKIGCAYVALDPGAPVARKKFIFDDSGAKLLLSTSDKKNELEGLPVMILDAPGILDGIPSHPPILEEEIRPQDSCYCLYTSGTTGTPKGCEITHENVIQAMLSFQRLFNGHWDQTSRWLQFASFHFDVSVLEQYWSWSVGICVTSCPRDTLFEDLAGTIRDLEITHIDLTPSLARLLSPKDVPSLCRGVFITGGEQLKQEILEAWGEYRVIYNGYGPTEVTIGCTMFPRVPRNGKPSNIGPQFDNVGSFVFKPGTTLPVLRGGVGELCVSGALVGRGYLNRPALTQQKFQYVDKLGERVYRTGDLVRLLHDGSFCFLGRIDDQVKLRGQRLEIGEINQVISDSAAEVGEVVTMVLKHSSQSQEQLISFFATTASKRHGKPTSRIDFDSRMDIILAKIHQACHKTLPGYMIPTHIIPVTVLPLNANNKIDQRELKVLYDNMTLEEMQRLSSRSWNHFQIISKDTNMIMALASKMTGVNLSTISPWSSIFELGLDSISAIAFSRLLRDSGFESAQPSVLMKYPTFIALADALGRTEEDNSAQRTQYQESKQRIAAFAHRNLAPVAQKLKIPLSSIEGVIPCTPLQEGMIYRYLESQKPLYFTSFNFELATTVNISRLKFAWLSAQRALQILRTKFPLAAGCYCQAILKEDDFPWFELVVSNDIEVEDISNSQYKKWCSEPSNLTGRVWEVGIVIGPTRRWMCLNIFHGLYDGNSLPLLLNLVSQAYVNNNNIPETPSYLECLIKGPFCKTPGAKEFWLRHLNGSPKSLPFTIGAQGDYSIVATLEIGSEGNLETLRRKLDVLEQAVFLACWLRVLESHVGFVPVVGIVVSGRALDMKGAEYIIGPLFNTLPCSVSDSSNISMADLVRSCHAYYVSTLQYQHTSLREIMKWVPQRGGTPLFDNLFVFQREPGKSFGSADSLWTLKASQAGSDYPVAFEVQRNHDGSLAITLVAQAGILTVETAQQLTLQFRDVLVNFLDDPSSRVYPAARGSDLAKNITVDSGDNVEPVTVGYSSDSSLSPFEWTFMASRLREEIASLANVDVLTIQETTSIFEVGLDSIDAIKLSSCLTKAGMRFSVTSIMRGRTIKNIMYLAESSDQNGIEELQTSLETLESELRHYFEKDEWDLAGIERILPASPLQEAMVAEMVVSDFKRYFNHDLLEIKDNVDIDILKRAWQKIVDLNPILRTSFVEVSNPRFPFTYAQLVHAPGIPINWSVIDIAGRSLDTMLEAQRQEAIALGSAKRPLLKIQVLSSANSGGKRLMFLSMPHAMYDGWSLDLLHRDIATYYSGQSPNIRESCDKVLGRILNSTSELGLQFWKGALSGVRPSAFPKQMDAGKDGSKVHRKEKVLSISRLGVISFCKAQGVTLQALGLTCWALVLAGYLRKLDVVFGTVLAGRDIQDANAEQIMFPLMNSVAVRIVLHGSRSDMLRYVQDTLVSISEYQHIPLRTAKQALGFGSQILFDTLFIFQKRPARDMSLQEPLYKSVGGHADVEYPVCIEMEEISDSILWRVACRDTVLGEPDVSKLLDRVNFVFDSIFRHPDSRTIDFNDDSMSIVQCPVFQEQDDCEDKDFNNTKQADMEFSPLEQEVRLVLSSVSNIPIEEITRDTTLFHLGLDSISAIKVAALLKRKNIILSVSDMLRSGTIPRMARAARPNEDDYPLEGHSAVLGMTLEEVNTPALLQTQGLNPDNIEKVMLATAGQVYMLNVHVNSNGQFFYPCFFYRAEGAAIAKDALEIAWASLIEKLPILRTQFIRTGKRSLPYLQVVLKDMINPIVWQKDLKAQKIRHLGIHSGNRVPVTLYASQCLGETILMLHIHHALYDAISLPRMINLLAAFCASPNTNRQVSCKVDISELIVYQHIKSPIQMREKFWRKYLTPDIDMEQQRIPPPNLNPPMNVDMIQIYRKSLVKDINKLEKLGRVHGVSAQALFLAVYAKVHASNIIPSSLNTIKIPRNLVIGVYLANRSHSLDGLPQLIAPTLNIVPLRISIEGDGKWPIFDMAQTIQRDLHEVGRVENSCVSLIEISDWTGVRVDTFVNFIKLPDTTEMIEGHGGSGSSAFTERAVQFSPLEEGKVDDNSCDYCYGDDGGDTDAVLENGDEEQRLTGIPRPNGNKNCGNHHDNKLGGYDEHPVSNGTYPDIFMPGIDVEAAIRDNALDVGIFSGSDRISRADAGHVLDELRREILEIMT
ncbi:hypothetical protein ACO22_04378 [Paracoccidioides brasiliensis]|uniref:Nonribosomal peptide synthetase sidC n=1 Tax=Paracoccidioides brasiliensis TaxID=121759 RepID=A0A1D2JDB9_PARBR|nr:hypothetical protein ACO22_04378 [Paracoccidioides brasiliensis]